MKEFLEDLRFLKERCGNSYIVALLSNRGIHCFIVLSTITFVVQV